jgi:hypothetical protein
VLVARAVFVVILLVVPGLRRGRSREQQHARAHCPISGSHDGQPYHLVEMRFRE